MRGPLGPICADCISVGLHLVRDGQQRQDPAGASLVRLRSAEQPPCEFCGRRDRRTFLGFQRSLARMNHVEVGSVICVDCLNKAGDLINQTARR